LVVLVLGSGSVNWVGTGRLECRRMESRLMRSVPSRYVRKRSKLYVSHATILLETRQHANDVEIVLFCIVLLAMERRPIGTEDGQDVVKA
jgi:hypothetical protein